MNSNIYRPYNQGYQDQPLHGIMLFFTFLNNSFFLLDCQGKVCLYNGTLDLNTCECRCSTYASGSQCERRKLFSYLIKLYYLFIFILLVDCSKAPSCPFYSPAQCVAVNVPLECPRLCGLCDRYEVLKRVYGENNLAPNSPIIKQTVTTTIR